jgi:hypothetical protein
VFKNHTLSLKNYHIILPFLLRDDRVNERDVDGAVTCGSVEARRRRAATHKKSIYIFSVFFSGHLSIKNNRVKEITSILLN